MNKMIASIAIGAVFLGGAVTNVSAEEYEVQQGDTLWQIADENNTTIENLVDINDLRTTTIQPKQVLVINETYIVVKGDTLSAISQDFNVTVQEIKTWNDLGTDNLSLGQELEIYGPIINKVNKEVEAAASEAVVTEEPVATQPAVEESVAQPVVEEQAPVAKETVQPVAEEPVQAATSQEGKTISVTATAYTAKCAGCSGITSTGVDLNSDPNAKVIAVDPSVIPLGSKVYVEGYGNAIAADIGGAIKGNKIDVHVPTKDAAFGWGVRTVNVTIIN